MTIKFANHKNEIERQIIVLLVEDILAAGFTIGVNDGDETTLENCTDEATVFAAMSSTDEDFLLLTKHDATGEITCKGWIRLVYGNDGWDVISDNTCSLEDNFPSIFTRANELSERFS